MSWVQLIAAWPEGGAIYVRREAIIALGSAYNDPYNMKGPMVRDLYQAGRDNPLIVLDSPDNVIKALDAMDGKS